MDVASVHTCHVSHSGNGGSPHAHQRSGARLSLSGNVQHTFTAAFQIEKNWKMFFTDSRAAILKNEKFSG